MLVLHRISRRRRRCSLLFLLLLLLLRRLLRWLLQVVHECLCLFDVRGESIHFRQYRQQSSNNILPRALEKGGEIIGPLRATGRREHVERIVGGGETAGTSGRCHSPSTMRSSSCSLSRHSSLMRDLHACRELDAIHSQILMFQRYLRFAHIHPQTRQQIE